MISHDKSFIFIHIPKTGGTSIEQSLRPYGKVLQGLANRRSIYYKHATVVSLRRSLGPSAYDSCFRFSFVRNPWDWIVSQYSFNRGFSPPFVFDSPHPLWGRVPPEFEDLSFAEWLPWWVETFGPSQTQMLLDENGEVSLDFIGRFERLKEDLHLLCDRLDLRPEPLPHLKASQHRAFQEYYDTSTKRLVGEKFRADFELLGYPLAW